jgi:hypothetical protein
MPHRRPRKPAPSRHQVGAKWVELGMSLGIKRRPTFRENYLPVNITDFP